MTRPRQAAVGAYGFRVVMDAPGVDGHELVPVAADAPTVHVAMHHSAFVEDREVVSDDAVVFGHRRRSGFSVCRSPLSVDIYSAVALPPASFVHPILTVPMSVAARWAGAVTLHAGAFEASGGAWAVVGRREAGKSTTLATMASRGCSVLADDLLVVDQLQVHAGPSCVDLRPDVASRFPQSRVVGKVGGRVRHRLDTARASPTVALRGLVDLAWHDDRCVRIDPIPRSELLRIIYAQEYIGLLGPADGIKILDLLAVPAWRVSRRRDWSMTDDVADRLLDLAASAA